MSFLFPLGLLALVSLPIVLVLHLIREHRQRQVVPSLMLWQNVPRRHDGTRRRLLPITLLLILHLIAATLLALALGQPQLVGLPSDGARHIALVLDTSTSMAARDGGATRFEQARSTARQILSGLQPGDRVTVVAGSARPGMLAEGGQADAAVIAAALDQLQPGGTGFDLEGALALAEAALDPRLSRRIVVISDGNTPTAGTLTAGVPVEWRQIGSGQENRAIVTFAARPWAGKIQVFARVANYGDQPFTGSMQLLADDAPLSTDLVSLAPGGERELTWSIPAGPARLRAALDGLDALPADDQAYLSISGARPIRTTLVSAQPEALQRALRAVPGVSVESVMPEGYQANAAADLTIFDGFLPPVWPDGAVLAINPPPESQLLQTVDVPRPISGERLVQKGALLEGLSFSGVSFGAVPTLSVPEWASTQLAAVGADGASEPETPLVLRGRDGQHEIAIWTFSIGSGNLPARLAFPLLVARTVRDLTATPPPASVGAGQSISVRPSTRATSLAIVAPDAARTELPAANARDLDIFTQPGFYTIEERAGASTIYTGVVGINAGAPGESDLRPQPAPDIAAPASDPGSGPQQHSMDLWPWLAGLTLVLLVFEWMYVLRRRRAG
jgi:hypothetical protein